MLYRIIYLALIESSQCRGVAIISICCTVLLLYNGYGYEFLFCFGIYMCVHQRWSDNDV